MKIQVVMLKSGNTHARDPQSYTTLCGRNASNVEVWGDFAANGNEPWCKVCYRRANTYSTIGLTNPE